MNCLFYIHGYPGPNGLLAGAEFYAHSIAKFMVSQDHSVNIIVTNTRKPSNSTSYLMDGVTVYVLPPENLEHLLFTEADVLIAHLDNTRIAIDKSKPFNLPIVHLIHNAFHFDFHKVKPEEVDLVIYNSLTLAQQLRFQAPSILGYPAVNVNEYKTDLTKPRDKYTLINLNKNKGGAAFFQLAKEFPERQFLGRVGSYGEQLIPDNIPNNVTISDNNLDMHSVYSDTHVLLMPSKMETWGRTAIEAMCSGIPVIASPTSGLMEAIGKENALWAESDRVSDWFDNIRKLDNPDLYMEMSQRGLNRAKYLNEKAEIQLHSVSLAIQSICQNNRRKVFCFASESHYLDHLAPIIHALPVTHVGLSIIYDKKSDNYERTEARAYEHNLLVLPNPNNTPIDNLLRLFSDIKNSVMLVGSYEDQINATKIIKSMKDRLVRIESGAGQSYIDNDSPLFAGGSGHSGLLATLVPGISSANAIKEKNPQLPIACIGCPKLDWYLFRHIKQRTGDDKLNVAISFRFTSNTQTPELQSSFKYFQTNISNLHNENSVNIIGHSHPLAKLQNWWKDLYEPNFEIILDTADILIIDNSSVGFEWLLAKRPFTILGLMNSPEYRMVVDHGMRFWELSREPDVHNFEMDELTGFSLINLFKMDKSFDFSNLLEQVYHYPLGISSQAAREALLSLLSVNQDGNDSNLSEVCYTRTITTDKGLRTKNNIEWIDTKLALIYEERNYCKIINKPDPKPIPYKLPTLSDKKDWDVNNFARFYQLTIPRYLKFEDIYEET